MKTLLSAVLFALVTLPVGAQGLPEIKPLLVHAFSSGVPDFSHGVVTGENNDYFGLSNRGGALDRGSLFRVEDISGVVSVHASFGDDDLRGFSPVGKLLFLNDGFFFGVTRDGGRLGAGTIFRVPLVGPATTLVDFSGKDGAAPGIAPLAGLADGPGSTLYGTTGGVPASHSGFDFTHYGSVFRVDEVTGRFENLVTFTGNGGAFPGDRPLGPVAVLMDGTVVGTTNRGGKFGRGTIFRVAPDGTFTSFPFTKFPGALPGAEPAGDLFVGSDGSVYGVANLASTASLDFDPGGALWKLPPGGVPSIVMEFTDEFLSPGNPFGGLQFVGTNQATILFKLGVSGSTGGIYNLNVASTPTLTLRKDFSDTGGLLPFGTPFTSGASLGPSPRLVFTTTTQLFEVDMTNTVGVLTTVEADGGTGEGSRPVDPVVFGPSPNNDLYQRTRQGGANGTGTIFRVPGSGSPAPYGSLPANYTSTFDSQPLGIDGTNVLLCRRSGGANGKGEILQFDGSNVTVRATFDGNVVGTPSHGLTPRAATNEFYGQGSFFDGSTTRTAVYVLNGPNISRVGGGIGLPNDFPNGALTRFDDNHFLSVVTRSGGGAPDRIFRIGVGGNVTTFTTFGTAALGRSPRSPLFKQPTNSTFLLPTFSLKSGGDPNIVRVTPTGMATKEASIVTGDTGHSSSPLAPLAGDLGSRVFGVLAQSGSDGSRGILYRLDTTGKVEVAYRFFPGNDSDNVGFDLSTGLTVGPDGAIYGSTQSGGPNGGGTIFKFFTQPEPTASTNAPAPVVDGATTFSGTLENNGYNVEYWWSYAEGSGKIALNQDTEHFFIGGFHSSENFMTAVAGLKGNRTYSVQFNTRVGFGPDAVASSGNILTFTTPNGTPIALDDTIIVNAEEGSFAGEVTDNDTEPDDDTLTITNISTPTYGSVAPDGTNPLKLVYTPTPAFFDPMQGASRDSFTYTISDGQMPPKTATATVTVLSDIVIVGEYAGLLFDDPEAAGIPREAQAIPSPDQIAAGFAQMAVGKNRRFSGRFSIGSRSFSVKGALTTERGTRITADKGRFNGTVRATPAGAEARISFNGRTLILRAGQAFAAVTGPTQVASDFTMRFDPTEVADPAAGGGLPAGSGYALVRQGKTARTTLVGALPDGTKFSAKSVLDAEGKLPFQTRLSKGKAGTFDGELMVDIMAGTVEPAPGTTARWEKPAQARSKRFPGGFGTRLMPFGGKHTVPAKNTPAIDIGAGQLVATFDRGGVFAPLTTAFTFTGAKAVPVDANNDALATAKFNGVTGLVSGTFRPAGKPVKYVGVVIQRDSSVAGYFLGPADTGSLDMVVTP